MIKKCDFKGCEKAGLCKCPKDRSLTDYWYFCQTHAAEYNKNWNYYAGMSADEIERENDARIFGPQNADSRNMDAQEFQKALDDFLIGRLRGSRPSAAVIKSLPKNVVAAFAAMDIGSGANLAAVQKQYRILAKAHHPDTGGDNAKFVKITSAYQTLRKFFQAK